MPMKSIPARIFTMLKGTVLFINSPNMTAIKVVNIKAEAPPRKVSQNLPLLEDVSTIAIWVLSPNSAKKTKRKVEKNSFQSIIS